MLEDDHLVGNRYLHGKSGYPLTLRWKGCLPFTQDGQLWLGVQYDDPFRGKHDGVYKGRQLFQTTMKGSGALIKASKGVLKSGPTFVQALEERYGPVDPTSEGPGDSVAGKVHLGSSGIVVDLPGIDEVKKRIGRLERLREVGLDGYWVSTLGGDANTLELLRARLKGQFPRDFSIEAEHRCAYIEPHFQLGERVERTRRYSQSSRWFTYPPVKVRKVPIPC